ncbi:hypothetical protein ACP93_06565 [Xanthomonas sp. NCPPB 1128]|nr:hypothetical protein ACP93_06565 [Xanthomonas sp. NCPPB 1128]
MQPASAPLHQLSFLSSASTRRRPSQLRLELEPAPERLARMQGVEQHGSAAPGWSMKLQLMPAA